MQMLRGEWFWLANEKQSNHSEEKFIYSVHKFAGIVRAEGESWEEEESNIHTIHVPVTTQTRKRVQTIGEYRTNRTGKCVILPASVNVNVCVLYVLQSRIKVTTFSSGARRLPEKYTQTALAHSV